MTKGAKTSEHFLSWALAAFTGGVGLDDPDPLDRFVAVLALGLIATAYTLGRSFVKAAQVKAGGGGDGASPTT